MPTKTSAKIVQKPRIFIGSSTEGLYIVNDLVELLHGHFAVRPWNQVIQNIPQLSKYAIETLGLELAQADAAVLIFTRDDSRDLRGKMDWVPRDNVILEFGFFVSKLGRDRVWILQEQGANVPTDILGITTYPIPSADDDDNGFGRKAKLQSFADILVKGGISASYSQTGIQNGGLGFAKTLLAERNRISGVEKRLQKYASDGSAGYGPIMVYSAPGAISAYSEALGLVHERFWTTTYLDSVFWTGNDPQVIYANQRMMTRLTESGERGAARRLFLLDQEPLQLAKSYKADWMHLRQVNRDASLRAMDIKFASLRDNIKRMTAAEFDVKAVYDRDQAYQNLLPTHMLPTTGELAIYDSFRVDVFEGGRSGCIDLVRSYNRAVTNFEAYLNSAVAYFEQLWNEAEPIESLLERIGQAIESARHHIDYTSNWLAMYEFDLDRNDDSLKVVEIRRVEEILRQEGRWGKIERYLDIGTCTGRYPICLRDAVVASGTIIGIDEDFDCVLFALGNVEKKHPRDKRIEIRLADFTTISPPTLGGPFDLITCMLGTLSHFGWDRRMDRRDTLQACLSRMAALLTDSGLLLLGTWSQYACENRAMLKIYLGSDRKRLADWTSRIDELEARLQEAGLQIVSVAHPEPRLDLLMCKRAALAK